METVKGLVEVVYRNDKGYFNIKLDNDEWYGFGKKKPEFSNGDSIQFTYEKNGRFSNADPTSVEATPAPKASTSSSTTGGVSRDQYWANKEKVDIVTKKEIRFQASRNAAIELVVAGLNAGIVDVGSSKTKGKQFEALLNHVGALTEEFVNSVLSYAEDKVKEDSANDVSGYAGEEE